MTSTRASISRIISSPTSGLWQARVVSNAGIARQILKQILKVCVSIVRQFLKQARKIVAWLARFFRTKDNRNTAERRCEYQG